MDTQSTLSLLTQIMTIIIGIFSFYGAVTKPIKDSINNLTNKIDVITKKANELRINFTRVEESVKSAHKRIDKIEGN